MEDDQKTGFPTGSKPSRPDPHLAAAFEDLATTVARRYARDDSAGQLSQPGADTCPGPGEWLRLACGETSAFESSALLAHAAQCSRCSAVVRQGIRSLAADDKASFDEIPEDLASTSPQWQHRLAVELAHTPIRGGRPRRSGILLWATSGLAALLVFVASFYVWWQHQNTPEKLLAEAYSQSRIFVLRVPGAGYTPVVPENHLRGGNGAMDREPTELLEARARIEHDLEKHPSDPHLLHMEARANLMEENFDAAIDILDRLLASGPVTAGLLLDDASAYYQRGAATGSENDRATALDYLRRADELAPYDPVVLFNEAVVMEDRGQLFNAVQTWNRFLVVERDPQWRNEGRERMNVLEKKLERLQSHRSRIEKHLSTAQAMRSLASNPAKVDMLDEELSTSDLPHLLYTAFPLPVDRSRGSPCPGRSICLAARTLLHALASSLQRNHQDPWLSQLLPPLGSTPSPQYLQAAQALANAITADNRGEYLSAQDWSIKASALFSSMRNTAGRDRADLEQAYALQRMSRMDACFQIAHALLGRDPQFAWVQGDALLEDGICDTGPGTASSTVPAFEQSLHLLDLHHYALLGMRARNQIGGVAVESGDKENASRIFTETMREFYSGDYPAFRGYTIMSGLAEIEKTTPRAHLELLLQHETMSLLKLTRADALYPYQRFDLAIAAIRAGNLLEAQEQMRKAREEVAAAQGDKGLESYLADSEVAMANLYLTRGDLNRARETLDSARLHLRGTDDFYIQRHYFAVRGQLDLALGHPQQMEAQLRSEILYEELQGRNVGAGNITAAHSDRDLYAVLVGIWLEEHRPAEDILALWERYRLRILGLPVPACPHKGLACLAPQLREALARMGSARMTGQIVLLDRTLIYQTTQKGVTWQSVPVSRQYVLDAAERLERAASSPAASQQSVDEAAQRVGNLFFSGLRKPSGDNQALLLETDPVLGNLPWAVADAAGGPIGLHFSLEEEPSLLLADSRSNRRSGAESEPLVVGASIAAGKSVLLPEALREAQTVARYAHGSTLLLGAGATEPQVLARLQSASVIHFAGHATEKDGATRLMLAPARKGSAPGTPYLDSSLLRKHPPRAAQLAVFSACSTGKREESWDHGMNDIVNTLASLGVPQVVATRWQIDSSSAVPMMNAFYGGLAHGLSVPQALTRARQTMIRSGRYSRPYYWAAYYASGWGGNSLKGIFRGAPN